jgi:hypothetical protein
MKKITLSLLIGFFLHLGLSAQELKTNSDYQRALLYFVALHSEIKQIEDKKTKGEAIIQRDETFPRIQKLYECAKQSYLLAKPQITDKKILDEWETWMPIWGKIITDLKICNFQERPLWQIPEFLISDSIIKEIEDSATCP